jgi:hypothetical protein
MVAKEAIKKCNDSSKWDAKWLPINPHPRKFHVNTTMHCVQNVMLVLAHTAWLVVVIKVC